MNKDLMLNSVYLVLIPHANPCFPLLWSTPLFPTHEDVSPERQEAADGHVHHRVFVPRLRRDLPGDVAGATRRLEAAGSVLPHDAADDREREAHQHPGPQDEEHGAGRQSLGGAAPPVDGVHDAPRQEQGSCGHEA